MNKFGKTMTVTAIVMVVFALALFGMKPGKKLRECGHPADPWYRVIRGSHCCAVWDMYFEIGAIEFGQAEYHLQHGTYTPSLGDVTNYMSRRWDYHFQLTTNGQHWYVAMQKQEGFPGNYLVVGDSNQVTIYFNTSAAATTNDLVLHRW
jgi:hypothetical protein